MTLPGRGRDPDEGDPTLTFRPESLEDDAATAVFGELPEAEQTVLRCGTYVGDYQLLYPIADGGMGAVWCARPRKRTLESPRSVVVKTILPQLAGEAHLRALFLDELRIASRIHHPNVVEIRETGESAGVLYAVMDDVDGGSLSAFQKWVVANHRPPRMPDMLACHLVAQAARGLHEAHELRGEDGTLLEVVHRDTSPQNILVDASGRALVIDFGLAKSFSRIAEPTRSRSMRGKLRYMAPEQAAGKPVDRRADVWALGATLHQLLTGTTPYDGPNDMVVLHALVTGQALLPLPKFVRPEVGAVIERCLAHDPAARFPTAAALADELDRIVASSDTPRPRADHADLIDGFVRSGRVRREESFDRALASLQRRKTIPDLGEVGSVSVEVAPESGEVPVAPTADRPEDDAALAPLAPLAPLDPLTAAATATTARSSRELTTTKPSRRRSKAPPPTAPKESLWKTFVAFVVMVLAVIAAVKLSQGPSRTPPAARVEPTVAPPQPVDPAKVDPAKVDPAKVDPAKVEVPPATTTVELGDDPPKPVAPPKWNGHHPAAKPAKPKPAEPIAKPAEPKPSTLDTLLDKRH